MRFIGVDLAWSPRNPSGGVVLSGSGRVLTSTSALGSDAEILAFVTQALPAGAPGIVAIDAPLAVPNETGARPCDRQVASLFGRYHAAPYPANRKNLNRYGDCGGWILGSQVQIRTEPENITLVEGEEIEFRLIIESYGWEGELDLHGIRWAPEQDVTLEYVYTGDIPSESGQIGLVGTPQRIAVGIRLKAHKLGYCYDPIPGHLVFQISPSSCDGGIGLAEMFTNEISLVALENIQELNLQTNFFNIFSCEDGGYLLGGLTSFSSFSDTL